MESFLKIFKELVIDTLTNLYEFTIQFGPKIILAIMILLLGWFFAVIFKKIIEKILRIVGIDVLSKKTGIKRFLENGGFEKKLSYLIGAIVYWIIIFSALIMAFNTLDLKIASLFIKKVIFYTPKVLIAIILISLGIFLARFLSKVVNASSRLARIPFYSILDKTTEYTVIGLTVIMVMQYLGISTAIIIQSFAVFFIVVPIIISLIFFVAGRDIMSNILAQKFINKQYKKGDKIKLGSISGEIDSIDSLNTKIVDENGEVIFIPNGRFTNEIIRKV